MGEALRARTAHLVAEYDHSVAILVEFFQLCKDLGIELAPVGRSLREVLAALRPDDRPVEVEGRDLVPSLVLADPVRLEDQPGCKVLPILLEIVQVAVDCLGKLRSEERGVSERLWPRVWGARAGRIDGTVSSFLQRSGVAHLRL